MTDEEKAHIKELLEAPMAAEEKERLLPIILDRPTIREGLSDWIEFIRLKRQQYEDSDKYSVTLVEGKLEGNATGEFSYDANFTQRRSDARAKTDGISNRNKLSYEEFRKNAMNPNRKKNLEHSKSLYKQDFAGRKSKTRVTLSQNKDHLFQNPVELAQYIADNVMIDIPENLDENDKSDELKLSKISEKRDQKLQDFVRADKEKSMTLSSQVLTNRNQDGLTKLNLKPISLDLKSDFDPVFPVQKTPTFEKPDLDFGAASQKLSQFQEGDIQFDFEEGNMEPIARKITESKRLESKTQQFGDSPKSKFQKTVQDTGEKNLSKFLKEKP